MLNQAGISVASFAPNAFDTREAYEEAILHALHEVGCRVAYPCRVYALIGHTLLAAYPSRIVNIHPSLLPSFPGKDASGQAIEHGVKVTGVTVHLVDEGMDTGPILAQRAVDVIDGDAEKTAEAIHAIEHSLYKETLILNELFSLVNLPYGRL